jgi:hypothetical protein
VRSDACVRRADAREACHAVMCHIMECNALYRTDAREAAPGEDHRERAEAARGRVYQVARGRDQDR